MSKPFELKTLAPKSSADAQPVFRLQPKYRNILELMRAKTHLPLGNIIEQCIDYALENMEDEANE